MYKPTKDQMNYYISQLNENSDEPILLAHAIAEEQTNLKINRDRTKLQLLEFRLKKERIQSSFYISSNN